MKTPSILRRMRRVGFGRLATVVILSAAALTLARFSTSIYIAKDVERAAFDVRSVLAAPAAPQDPRIVLVTFTDDTIERTGKISPLDRSVLARALRAIDAMHPKMIGIDILIDQPQPEDQALIAALRASRAPVFLAFARYASNPGSMQPWQERFERRFQASIGSPRVLPASIRLEDDPDGAMRRWPEPRAGDPPRLVDRIAGYHVPPGYVRSIRFRLPKTVDRPVFASFPIDLFDGATASMFADQIKGRIVLIGGDISDVDRFDVPATRGSHVKMTGLEVHATMIAQALDRRFPSAPERSLLWAIAFLVVLAAAATGLGDLAGWRMTLALFAQFSAMILVPFLMERGGIDTRTVPQFGWIGGWMLAYTAAAALARGVASDARRFAQGALGRYLPRDVAAEILRDPDQLTLSGERRQIYALFSDLEGFTKLTHAVSPEAIATLLNAYLDKMSAVVLAYGGTIDKFVGDGVVAFWGAPIARDDDADQAMSAVLAMLEAGDRFRRDAPASAPPIGRTRVGLHFGDAVVGNFGGEKRIQYTALGDAMNTAARLENANKALSTRALISAEAASRMTEPPLRAMGRITVRGRSTPVEVFEPHGANDNETTDAMLARYRAGDGGALAAFDIAAASRPDDAALAHLVTRLRAVGPGGSYAVD